MSSDKLEQVERWRRLATPPERAPMGHHLAPPTPLAKRMQLEQEIRSLRTALLEAAATVEVLMRAAEGER